MGEYLLRRLLLFIPTLFLVSVVIFFLSRFSPGDPVIQFMGVDPFSESVQGNSSLEANNREYTIAARQLGLDKPVFYFSFTGLAWPDSLHRIVRRDHRQNLSRLVSRYGNWPAVESWYLLCKQVATDVYRLPGNYFSDQALFRRNMQLLYVSHEDERILRLLEEMAGAAVQPDSAAPVSGLSPIHLIDRLQRGYNDLQASATPWRRMIPVLYWHGFDNQYHRWLGGIVTGDWGVSLKDRQPVLRKIGQAAFWTLVLNIPALVIAFGIAIPLGVWMAQEEGRPTGRLAGILLYMLYSLPGFWVATLLVLFFTTPEYGNWMHLFPSAGLSRLPASAPFWTRFLDTAAHLVLPIFCIVYPALAFIAQQVKGSMLENMQQDYIKTARAKGLSEIFVYWRHAFRNALFPLITLGGSAFAGLLSGSIVIEFIFNIPGMGRLVYGAILDNDWPVTFGVILISALLTIVGYLLTDILYTWAHPKVAFNTREP